MHQFLSFHPQMKTNRMTSTNFEETQFFSTQYDRGLDWYLRLFASNETNNKTIFEKSANYFSNPNSPRRIRVLFNENVQLVALILDPAYRAHSWYQVHSLISQNYIYIHSIKYLNV